MDLIKEAIETRRVLHRRPEEGWTEFETTWLVSERLKSLGYSVRIGLDAIDPEAVMGRDEKLVKLGEERACAHGVPASFIEATSGYTGAAGDFDTGRAGPLTCLRFDMDCVLVGESRDPSHLPFREGFASERPGLMHACGHDAHTSVGLAVARWIAEHKDELCGRFRLLFQPAEEGVRGALPMASKGLVDDADWFFGSHVGVVHEPGSVIITDKGFLATTKIDVLIEGVPSHAGADPEKGRSALLAASAAALMMEGIPRHSGGATRISIGRMIAGEGRNVTPAHALIQLETRGASHELNQYMVENVKNIVKGVESAYGVTASIKKMGEATTLLTTEKGCQMIREAAEAVLGADHVRTLSDCAGSEDCTVLLRRAIEHGAQGAFFLWGCRHTGHHRADFDIEDTETIPNAIRVFEEIVRRTNKR